MDFGVDGGGFYTGGLPSACGGVVLGFGWGVFEQRLEPSGHGYGRGGNVGFEFAFVVERAFGESELE
jgi:hypothetical protein